MKDGLMLLLTAAVCAAGAALFFHLFGSDALNMIVLLALVGAVGDNFRLREMGAKPEGKRTWL